jgi:hypothetical protein
MQHHMFTSVHGQEYLLDVTWLGLIKHVPLTVVQAAAIA